MVISEAGVHDKVIGLVYVSALSPDAGETTAQLYQGFAPTPECVIDTRSDGFGFVRPANFKAMISATPMLRSWRPPRCRSRCPRSANACNTLPGRASRAGP
ncbi:hypothetical protein [Xanthomonas axonopodis]|nr:hypothetical protein [Xanthomonas axonopodis]